MIEVILMKVTHCNDLAKLPVSLDPQMPLALSTSKGEWVERRGVEVVVYLR